jgi:phosphoenolpyruvate synthase/pyruvate phosphate dikinase
MICKDFDLGFSELGWQRINMRRVEHVIGAEMLHNLYSRHWPRINSVRFRHTSTYFKDGLVESFAPKHEWVYLQRVLATRFKLLDPVLIREIEAILSPTYELIHELIARCENTDLTKLSDDELALLLIDIIDLPLGEIYKLNVVQIEYGLTKALNDILADYESNPEDRALLLSELIAPGVMTIAQEEELAIDELRSKLRLKQLSDPFANKQYKHQLETLVAQFAPKHCAYGELPPTIDEYRNKILFLETQQSAIKSDADIRNLLAQQKSASEKLLARLDDPRLSLLCPLMAKIGDFRDKNKAKLGQTMPHRHAVLNEIARRKKLSDAEVRYYLKSEFVLLLFDDIRVSKKEIILRQAQGIVFVRNEHMEVGARKPESSGAQDVDRLRGICAAKGSATGKVVVVHGKEDNHKVQAGDVMVAIGTDFDVLDAMYRASAIITEEGGLLSHASVVSRELEKPCLIGVAKATELLKDGQSVRVDATAGFVEILHD